MSERREAATIGLSEIDRDIRDIGFPVRIAPRDGRSPRCGTWRTSTRDPKARGTLARTPAGPARSLGRTPAGTSRTPVGAGRTRATARRSRIQSAGWNNAVVDQPRSRAPRSRPSLAPGLWRPRRGSPGSARTACRCRFGSHGYDQRRRHRPERPRLHRQRRADADRQVRRRASTVPAVELGGVAIRAAVERAGLPEGTPIDEVLMGQVLQAGVGQAPARQAALEAGLPDTPARRRSTASADRA